MRNFIAILLISTFLLTSCDSGAKKEPEVELGELILISTSIDGSPTSTNFVKDNKISVYVYNSGNPGDVIINNVINTFDGSVWVPDVPMRWRDTTTNYDFMALFPTRAIASYPKEVVALTDAASENDMMVATKNGVIATTEAVSLVFKHLMTKVVVNLTFTNEFGTAPVVQRVVFKAKKMADIDYSTANATAVGEPVYMTLSRQGTTDTYIGVTVPQTIIAGSNMLEVYLEGVSEPCICTTDKNVVLLQQKVEQMPFVVGLNKVALGNVVINDWGSVESIDGGNIQ